MKVPAVLSRLIVMKGFAMMLMTAFAQSTAAPTEPPCTSAEARAFQFWIGAWKVTTPGGKLLGENTIESLLGGCVLMENWRDGRGQEGKSWNYWHAPSKTWKQHWVDAAGRVTEYVGASTPKGMRFEADEPGLKRVMTFTRLEDGSIEQKIEVSRDGGKTWTTGFLGVYRKR
jgi:hypothetical protein